MQDVVITKGWYRGEEVINLPCKLANIIKFGARGWYGNFQIPGKGIVRIQLEDENCVEYKGKIKLNDTIAEEETEDQIIARIKERFEMFSYSINGVATDDIRALIVAGAPGIGKTETISRILEEHEKKNGLNFEIVRGNIVSSYQLYQLLFMNSEEDNVLVLDDCDAILRDNNSLNILKAALESGERPRIISYKSQSVMNLGMPTEFEYKGRMIFITNENFQKIIDKDTSVLAKHLRALIDRSLYLDLMLHSRKEVYCRIKEMMHDHQLLAHKDIDKKFEPHILLWIKNHMDEIRSLSLRTPIHLAELISTNETNWKRMANVFFLRNGR